MPKFGRRGRGGACEAGSRASYARHAAAPCSEQSDAGRKGEDVPSDADELAQIEARVLGATPVGARILRMHERQRDERDDRGIYKDARCRPRGRQQVQDRRIDIANDQLK